MKNILAAFLAFTILAQTLINVGIGVYYHINKQYIATQLCENRNNPNLHCNGHCFLSKQLKKAEQGESKSQSQLLKEKEEVMAGFNKFDGLQIFPNYQAVGLLPFGNTILPNSPAPEILTPPKILA